LQWSVPRELLWAIIFGLAVFVIALWPSHYPYSQTPHVQPQHKTENGVSSGGPSEHAPAPQIKADSEQQNEHAGEHASEITVLGIKPGEWLLGIVTWMLWLATVRLVTEGKLASERVIAETRRIGEAQIRAYVDIRDVAVIFVGMPGILHSPGGQDAQPIIRITAKNTGQSPAKDFVWNPTIQYFGMGAETKLKTGELGGNWRDIRGSGISVGHEHVDSAMISGMLLLRFLQESAANTGSVIVRLAIQFEFEDVFDQRIVDIAYFAGGFVRSEVVQTPFGATEWSGKLSRIHRPNDWPEDKEEK
jgi:hypothetical protein